MKSLNRSAISDKMRATFKFMGFIELGILIPTLYETQFVKKGLCRIKFYTNGYNKEYNTFRVRWWPLTSRNTTASEPIDLYVTFDKLLEIISQHLKKQEQDNVIKLYQNIE